MTVLDGDQATYEVYSESGRQYTVDVAGDGCTCPDHQQRGTECKHLRRVRLETNCDPKGWRAVSGEVGAAILGIDEEIHRLEEQIRDLVSAQRSLERLLDRMDDHRPQGQPTDLEAPSSGLTPADD